jgi:putative phosphoribosyl transferase
MAGQSVHDLAAPAFHDRRDAGQRLAERVAALGLEAPIVMALPRGGVPVAFEVARRLGAPLDVVVVRKLGAPGAPEFGIGALGEGGVRLVNSAAVAALGITESELDSVVGREQEELARRLERYRGDRAPIALEGRTVVLVDDGVATGGTAVVGARVLRARGAQRIVLAVPVGPPELGERVADVLDELVQLEAPEDFFAVGQAHELFGQTSDDEVRALLEAAHEGREPVPLADPPADPATGGLDWARVRRLSIAIAAGAARLPGELALPPAPLGLVVFVHGSGSSRLSPRNRRVATVLNGKRLATLLFDLLTSDEALDRENVFDIDLLSQRLLAALGWAQAEPEARSLPLGCFGASTGAAAALQAAARAPETVRAVVSRGGRPDLAAPWLNGVEAPTLLIVGGDDRVVRTLNAQARAAMRCPTELAVIPGATHLFEEPGALEEVARLAGEWFARHLQTTPEPSTAARPREPPT